jgi:hypothetical protein
LDLEYGAWVRAKMRLSRETLVVICVAFAAFAFVYPLNAQDPSRLGLTQAVVLHASISIDAYASETGDRARHAGHWYSDKAPGISFLAVPFVRGGIDAARIARRLPSDLEDRGLWNRWPLLFAARIATGGLIYLFSVLLLWRVAELHRPGTGPMVAVTFGLATLAFPFAATVFGHLAAGILAFSAWLVLWQWPTRQAFWAGAGFLAGLAVFFEYQAALAAIIVLAYLVIRTRRPLAVLLFLAGALPVGVALGAYNWVAFGSPFHFSYGYVDIPSQKEGFFGISAPTWAGLDAVLFGQHGIVREQPILVVAAVGLLLLWRRGLRAEAAACGATTLVFALMTSSYFDPYGGVSPGPRFFVPALPFLAVGLAEAFVRWPMVTTVVAIASGARMMFAAARWNPGPDWPTLWTQFGLSADAAAILVALPAAAAFALALTLSPAARKRFPRVADRWLPRDRYHAPRP